MSTDPKDIDTSNFTEKEKEFFKKYGRLPPATLLQKKEKKYFDSADWALNGAPRNAGGDSKEVKQPAPNSTIKE